MMVRLSELVGRLGGECTAARETRGDPAVRDVHLDSRRVEPGSLFAALPGLAVDGAMFAGQALERGAVAVLSPARLDELLSRRGDWANWVHPQARRVAGEAAAMVHGYPARDMGVVGITGTNGKSTVASFAAQLLEHAGRRPALFGTVEFRPWGVEPRAATHTTPDAGELQRLCRESATGGGDSVVLEVSSHALDQERISGLALDVAVFTNLSRDHLDYHPGMEAYAAAKEKIFAHLREGGTAVINADDSAAAQMIRAAERSSARVVTYGTGPRVGLGAFDVHAGPGGSHLFLEGMGIPRTGLFLPLVGLHNIENALAATAAVLSLGASSSRVLEGLATISPPVGRLEPVDVGERGFRVFVDYAHTPHALERVLGALREILASEAVEHGGRSASTDPPARLIAVFGCGGNRDRDKRAPMGRIVGRLADVAMVTSDNPRDEDPRAIIDDVLTGLDSAAAEVLVEEDRRTAIRHAMQIARPGDVILVGGKGHETWQQLRGKREPFEDRRVIREELP